MCRVNSLDPIGIKIRIKTREAENQEIGYHFVPSVLVVLALHFGKSKNYPSEFPNMVIIYSTRMKFRRARTARSKSEETCFQVPEQHSRQTKSFKFLFRGSIGRAKRKYYSFSLFWLQASFVPVRFFTASDCFSHFDWGFFHFLALSDSASWIWLVVIFYPSDSRTSGHWIWLRFVYPSDHALQATL